MSLKKFFEDDDGLTHTLESIIGVFLLIGTITFMTSIIPSTSHKTEDYSKVQLVNIGRDSMDLIEVSPISSVIPDFWSNVCREYNLTADKMYVASGSSINFTVRDMINDYVYKYLTIEETNLNTGNIISKNFYGPNYAWNFSLSDIDEYNFRAYDNGAGSNCSTISNSLTIIAGHYFLVTNVYGIYDTGNVNGTVYYTNWSGAPNLNVQIFYCQGNSYPCTGNKFKIIGNTTTTIGGNFSLAWPNGQNTGTYYIRAIDSGGNSSNVHKIIYSNKNNGGMLCCDSTIYETDSVNLTLYNGTFNGNSIGNVLTINGIFYNQWERNPLYASEMRLTWFNDTMLTLTAYTSGNYTIQVLRSGNSPQTNVVEVIVLPINANCLFGKCIKCSRFNSTELNLYLKTFVPPNVNYNLYLISPNGIICNDCLPEFKSIINGYPTDEAVTVNKIFNIPSVNGNLKELRMILWYK